MYSTETDQHQAVRYIRLSRADSGTSRRISSNKLYTYRGAGKGERDGAFVEDAKFGGLVGDDEDYLLKQYQVEPLSDKY